MPQHKGCGPQRRVIEGLRLAGVLVLFLSPLQANPEWFEGLPKWAKNKPRGTVTVAPGAHPLKTTLRVPQRVSLVREERHVRDMPSLQAAPDFEGEWLVFFENGRRKKNWNGNFGSWMENINLQCRNRCNGLAWGGAQMSGLRNLRVEYPTEIGILIQPSTSRAVIESIDVIGSTQKAGHQGTGMIFNKAWGLDVGSIHTHRLEKGVVFQGSHTTNVSALVSEHTLTPITIRSGSSNISIGPCDIQTAGSVVIDLTKAGRNITIWGRVRRSPKITHYLDRAGKLQELAKGSHTSNGKSFRIEIK